MVTLVKKYQKTSKTEEKPSFFANSARLCSVFFAIAYPLWIHCGVDKASILDLFSGIAINILFSIAPPILGGFGQVLGPFLAKFDRIGQVLGPFLAKLDGLAGYRPPPKEVAKVRPPPQLLWQPFWPNLMDFARIGWFGSIFGEIVMVYGLINHLINK